jgi:hypothetical protein
MGGKVRRSTSRQLGKFHLYLGRGKLQLENSWSARNPGENFGLEYFIIVKG